MSEETGSASHSTSGKTEQDAQAPQSEETEKDEDQADGGKASEKQIRNGRRKKNKKKKKKAPPPQRHFPKEKPGESALDAIKILSSTLPRIPSTTSRLLEFFIRKESRLSLNQSPLLAFCIQQTILAAQECLRRLTDVTITYSVIRNLVENLLVLQQRHIKGSIYDMAAFAVYIRKLCAAIGELGTQLEKMSEVRVTDWQAVGEKSVNSCKATNEQQQVPFTEYIPKLEDFKNIKLLGKGGFGTVYSVCFQPSGAMCSMKLVAIEKFNELKHACVDKLTASIIKSPHLLRYFVAFQAKDAYVTVMELFNSIDVLVLITSSQFIQIQIVRLITVQLFVALEHLHLRGIIHRDVKASNILIRDSGHVKLFDYDTNKVSLGHHLRRVIRLYFRRTAEEFNDHEIAGTTAYLSPEVLKCQPYGRACDWWSFGICAYKMCTGRVPFRAIKLEDYKSKICCDPLTWPKLSEHPHSATPELKELVFKLLRKDPIKRMGSRIYSDIKNHPFFGKMKTALMWKTPKLLDSRNISNIIAKEQSKTKADSTISNADNSELSTSSSTVSQKYIYFEDVDDEPDVNNHKALYTFASVRFKKLTDRLRATDNKSFKNIETFLIPRTPPSECIDYTKRDEGESILLPSLSIQKTENDRFVMLQEKTDIKITRTKSFGIFWSYGINLSIVEGEGSLTYHMVSSIKSGSPAEASDIVFGDIIIAINGVKCVGLPLQIPLNIMNNNSESSMTLTVFLYNSFRLVQRNKDILEFVKNFEAVDAVVERVKATKNPEATFGFTTFEGKAWDNATEMFVYVHIVDYVEHDIKVCEPKAFGLYIGDIIKRIGSEFLTDTMPRTSVLSKISKHKEGQLSLQVLPVSVIRKKELHESHLNDIDIVEPQEASVSIAEENDLIDE